MAEENNKPSTENEELEGEGGAEDEGSDVSARVDRVSENLAKTNADMAAGFDDLKKTLKSQTHVKGEKTPEQLASENEARIAANMPDVPEIPDRDDPAYTDDASFKAAQAKYKKDLKAWNAKVVAQANKNATEGAAEVVRKLLEERDAKTAKERMGRDLDKARAVISSLPDADKVQKGLVSLEVGESEVSRIMNDYSDEEQRAIFGSLGRDSDLRAEMNAAKHDPFKRGALTERIVSRLRDAKQKDGNRANLGGKMLGGGAAKQQEKVFDPTADNTAFWKKHDANASGQIH